MSLSVQQLNLSVALTVPTLSTASFSAVTMMGQTLSVDTVRAAVIRPTSTVMTIGTSTKATAIIGSNVAIVANTINIPAQTLLVSTANVIVTDSNVYVNSGSATISGAGFTVMSGQVSEIAYAKIDGSNGWYFYSPAGTLQVPYLSAQNVSATTISAYTLSATGLNVASQLAVGGNLSATTANITDLSFIAGALGVSLGTTTFTGASLTAYTVSAGTLSVGTLNLSGITAPSLSFTTVSTQNVYVTNTVSTAGLSVGTTTSTYNLSIDTLNVSQVSRTFNYPPLPMYLDYGNGLPHPTNIATTYTPAFVSTRFNEGFTFVHPASPAVLTGNATLTSDLTMYIASGYSARSGPISLSVFQSDGATIMVRFRPTVSTMSTAQIVFRAGEDVDSNTGCVNLYANGYWNLGALRYGGQTDEPSAATTSPTSGQYITAAITFSGAGSGLAPVITTYDSVGVSRYQYPVAANLANSMATFQILPNANMDVEIAAIAVWRTPLNNTYMTDAYRVFNFIQYGDVHFARGINTGTLSGDVELTVGTLYATSCNWPTVAIPNRVRVFHMETGDLTISNTTIRTDSAYISNVVCSGTLSAYAFNTFGTTTVNGTTTATLVVANGTTATPAMQVTTFLSAGTVQIVGDGVQFTSTPVVSNLSVVTGLTVRDLSVTTAATTLLSVFAPITYVSTFMSQPTTFAGTTAAQTENLYTTSTLYMSSLKFQTPTGLGPAIRLDYGRATCTGGSVTVSLKDTMFSQAPRVVITPIAVSGVSTEIHAISVMSDRFVANCNLSTNADFSWIAMGVNNRDVMPIISSASPLSGSTLGNTVVTIHGDRMSTVTAVAFGGVTASSFAVVNSTQITATTAAGGSDGASGLALTNAYGTTISSGGWTYFAPTTLSSANVSAGPVAGGTIVGLTGTLMSDILGITVGTTSVASFTVNTSTQLSFTTAATGTAGLFDITAYTAAATAVLSNAFYYYSPIGVSSLDVSTGELAGGTTVVITGSGFSPATGVTFCGISATSVVVNSDSQITAVTGTATTLGLGDVVVYSPYGSGTLSNGFTYITNSATYTKLVDTMTSGAQSSMYVIYHTRSVRSAYTGPVMKIRRSSDNAEIDVKSDPFYNWTVVNANKDTLDTWLGADTAYVRTWYDQSGNARHATQTNTTYQPTLDLTNRLVDFAGTKYFDLPSDAMPGANSSSTIVLKHGTWSGSHLFSSGPQSTTTDSNNLYKSSTSYVNNWGTGSAFTFGTVTTGNVITIKYDQTNRTAYTNGTSTSTQASTSHNQQSGSSYLGGVGSSNSFDGQLYFFYVANSAFSNADRAIPEGDSQSVSSQYSRYFGMTDISAYSNVNASSSYFNKVIWDATRNLFVIIDNTNSSSTPVLTSPDGTTWTRRSVTAGTDIMRDILSSSTALVTIGRGYAVRRSLDGATWTANSGASGESMDSNGSRIVVVGENQATFYSDDSGSSWTQGGDVGNLVTLVRWFPPTSKFVTFPREGNTQMYESTNGVSWSANGSVPENAYWYAAAYSAAQSTMMAITIGRNVYTTTNGSSWTSVGTIASGDVRGLMYSSYFDMWVAATTNGLYFSTNGAFWRLLQPLSITTYSYGNWDYSPTINAGVLAFGTKAFYSDTPSRGSIQFSSGNNLSIANDADFRVGSGDFTIEWFQYQKLAGTTPYIFSIGTNHAFSIESGVAKVWMNGSAVISTSVASFLGRWAHFAITRSGTTLALYKDGLRVTTATDSSNITDSSNALRIANTTTTTAGNQFTGLITNFHWCKGTAVYTGSTYTIPNAELLGNANSKLLLNAPSSTFANDQLLTKTVTNTSATFNYASPFE